MTKPTGITFYLSHYNYIKALYRKAVSLERINSLSRLHFLKDEVRLKSACANKSRYENLTSTKSVEKPWNYKKITLSVM